MVSLDDVHAARERIKDYAIRTPTVALNFTPENLKNSKILMKLENLQPIGSFKVRGAANAILSLPKEELTEGVYTASAGNFAQGLAWAACELGIPCQALVPDHAPKIKLDAIERFGAGVHKISYNDWWKVIQTHQYHSMNGTFLHPVCEKMVMAGNGTIGLEIFEECPSVDAVIVPFGGGGLSCGIAAAIKALKPEVKVFACEVETAAPLATTLAAGVITPCEYQSSFVDGMGSRCVLEEMWPYVKELLDGSIVVSLKEIADAVRLIATRNHIIAEGAAAATVAAALTGKAGEGNIVCIISGGNIDNEKLVKILQGEVP